MKRNKYGFSDDDDGPELEAVTNTADTQTCADSNTVPEPEILKDIGTADLTVDQIRRLEDKDLQHRLFGAKQRCKMGFKQAQAKKDAARLLQEYNRRFPHSPFRVQHRSVHPPPNGKPPTSNES